MNATISHTPQPTHPFSLSRRQLFAQLGGGFGALGVGKLTPRTTDTCHGAAFPAPCHARHLPVHEWWTFSN